MSSHVWKMVYHSLRRVNRKIPRQGRACQYPDTLIVALYLWAVFHDRPLSWAVDRSNYSSVFRPRRLPSRSQFGRRIRSARCQALLHALNRELARVDDVPNIFLMDSRPLRVGPYSGDPDVRKGYTKDGFVKGYKMHALAARQGQIVAWRLTPLNRNDKPVAWELVEEARPQGLVLADGAYDSGALYDHMYRSTERNCSHHFRRMRAADIDPNRRHAWQRRECGSTARRMFTGSALASSGSSANNQVSEAGWRQSLPGSVGGRVYGVGSRPSSSCTTPDWPSGGKPHDVRAHSY